MGIFLTTVGLLLLVLLVLAAPLFVIAGKLGMKGVVRNWGLAALGIAVFFGGVAMSSERLVAQCFDSAFDECLDVGYQGFMVTVVGLYAVAAWFRASGLRE